MDLDHERDRILRQKVRPAQKARMFIARAQELQLDSQQWQYLVWTLPVDVLDAVAQIRQKDRMAQPDIGFSTQDLELFQQAVAANLAVHPYFVDLVNRSIPEGTATKSELAQVCKHVDQGNRQGEGVREHLLQ